MTRKRSIRILSWNVNGIRAAHRKGFLDWVKETSPDVLCVQETKAQPEQIPAELLNPAALTGAWASAERKGYSGVATFFRLKPLKIQKGFGIPRFDSEGRVLITEFEEFTLLNIYFPNGQKDETRLRYKLEFYDSALKFFNDLRKKGKRLVISGDVNTAHSTIDLERPEANADSSGFLPVERKWIDDLVHAGYIDTFRFLHPERREYSWWDLKSRARERNVGWRIDYHFVSEDLKDHLKEAFILGEVAGSDHCPVGLTLSF